MQADLGLHCLQKELFDTTQCMNGEQGPDVHLNLLILHMFKDRFLHDMAHMKFIQTLVRQDVGEAVLYIEYLYNAQFLQELRQILILFR